MRFSLLCASAALAASLVLSGCSTNGSSSAIPGGSSTTSMAGHRAQLHMVITGVHHAYTCSGSGLYACYLVNNGATDFEWCIVNVTSGNCTSDLAPGKWSWTNTAPIPGKPNTEKISTMKPTGAVKSTWVGLTKSGHVANPINNDIVVKNSVKYTKGKPGYEFSWQACAKSGPYKGSCVAPPGAIGIIVGNY